MTKLVAISLAILALVVAQPAFTQDKKIDKSKIMDGPDLSDQPAGTVFSTKLSHKQMRILNLLGKRDPKLRRKIEKKLNRIANWRDRYVYLTKQTNKIHERIDAAELNYKNGNLSKQKLTDNLYIGIFIEDLAKDIRQRYEIHLQANPDNPSFKIKGSEYEKRQNEYYEAYRAFRAERRKNFGLHEEVGKTEPLKKKAEGEPKKPETEKPENPEKTKKVSSCDGTPGEKNCVGEGSEFAVVDDWDGPYRSNIAFADRVVEFSVGSPKPTKGGFDPANALGAPDWDGDDDGPTYTTLGCGGTLVVQFSGEPVDRPGPDFRVYEIGPNVEPYSVDISSDGQTWHSLGTATQTGDFDMAGAAPEGHAYGFLRITDLQQKCGPGWPGADIDAIEALATNELTDHRDLSGAWAARFNWKNTGWVGGMTFCLRQEGNKVAGSYTWDGGNRRGTLEGGILGGDRLDYEFSDSDCSGSGHFLITPGDSSMTGAYRCSGGTGQWELASLGQACDPEPGGRRSSLTDVEIVEPASLDPIDEIAIGQSFRVRLTFAEDPGAEITEIVTIGTANGVAQEIEVIGSSRVIVSDPISVVSAEAMPPGVEP